MMYKESYTVKEIADILGVSKTTIQKYIKASAIDYDYIEKNKQYFSLDKTKNIIMGVRSDFDIAEIENRQPPTENCQSTTENQTANFKENNKAQKQDSGEGWRNVGEVQQPPTNNRQPTTKTTTENLENKLYEMIDTLQKQLDIKDEQIKGLNKQLEIKDKQIEDYSNRLAEALQLTAGQQLIHAVDKKEMLMDNKDDNSIVNISDDVKEEKEEEKSIIKKLFSIFK